MSHNLFCEITIVLSHYPRFTQTTVNFLEVKCSLTRDFSPFPSQIEGSQKYTFDVVRELSH